MDVVKTIFVCMMWIAHSLFQKLRFNQSHYADPPLHKPIKLPSKRVARLKNDIIDYKVRKKESPSKCHIREQPVHLLFNENAHSLINLSDIVTPQEEAMLRCLCAKGFARNATFRTHSANAEDELDIPRDIFTNVWINSCSPT